MSFIHSCATYSISHHKCFNLVKDVGHILAFRKLFIVERRNPFSFKQAVVFGIFINIKKIGQTLVILIHLPQGCFSILTRDLFVPLKWFIDGFISGKIDRGTVHNAWPRQFTCLQIWHKILAVPIFPGLPCGSVGKESACNAGDPA